MKQTNDDLTIEETRTLAIELLNAYYPKCSPDVAPVKRIRAYWKADNKHGFFLALVYHGDDSDIRDLHRLLATKDFDGHQQISRTRQLADPTHVWSFLDEMIQKYFALFNKLYSDNSSCHTELPGEGEEDEQLKNEAENSESDSECEDPTKSRKKPKKEPSHDNMKKALKKRDEHCLFCWSKSQLQGAHIIAQKVIARADEQDSIFTRVGITHKHQTQNGLLLCSQCHGEFDQLARYVDEVDEKLVVKIIQTSNDTTSEEYREWQALVGELGSIRGLRLRYWNDNRLAVETNGEMALYFMLNDPDQLPNRKALKLHRTACLMWKMAGGAEPHDDMCYDDDQDICVFAGSQRKNIEEWLDSTRSSSSTTVIDNTIETQ